MSTKHKAKTRKQRTPASPPSLALVTRTATPAGGNERVDLTDAGRAVVTARAAQGKSQSTIAATLGVSLACFKGVMKRDEATRISWDKGRGLLEDELTELLLKNARKGLFLAQCYLTKALFAWREGEAPDQRAAIQVILPAPMSDAEYVRHLKFKQQAGALPLPPPIDVRNATDAETEDAPVVPQSGRIVR